MPRKCLLFDQTLIPKLYLFVLSVNDLNFNHIFNNPNEKNIIDTDFVI